MAAPPRMSALTPSAEGHAPLRLAIVLLLYRNLRTPDLDRADRLKG